MKRTSPPILIAMLAFAGASLAAEEREPLYHESLRPQFHFTARYWDDYQLHPPNHHEGWMNDINGLVHNDGEYHFFAQRWWSAWLHAVSTDLIHWEERKPAFGKGGEFGGTQSGGGVIDLHNSSGLGDGKTPPMIAFWSSTDNLSQCISYSLDRGRTWTKYEKNPVLVHADRDPKVFWYEPDKKWIMILYGESKGEASPAAYGFNGEENDAHDLRGCVSGEWNASVLRVFDDGKVIVSDQAGESAAVIDANRRNVGGEAFHIGAKVNGTEFLHGDIAEILVYDRPLSDEETGRTIRSLRSEWNIGETDGDRRIPADGLVLHLDASRANAGEGGRVSLWEDLSGKGNDMKQPEPDRMPGLFPDAPGGRPVIRFSGAQSLHGPAVIAEGDDSFSIVALWRHRQAESSQVICEQNAAGVEAGRRAALLAVNKDDRENCYFLFSSKNLLEWEKLPVTIPDSYECPDMFELPVEGGNGMRKWVVIDGNGDYIIGSFDGTRFTTETSKRKGDHGRNFYATMTFENMPASDPRRIQIAWMRGWDDYPKNMPFNQQASFPCELTLRKVGGDLILCRNPIREISRIYADEFSMADLILNPGENPLADIEGELFDIWLGIDVTRSQCDEIVLNLRGNTVKYDLKKQTLHSHGTEIPLKPEAGMIDIRVLMDRLSIETFGNHGEVSITNIARQNEASPHLELSARGGEAAIRSLEVRKLRSIWK